MPNLTESTFKENSNRTFVGKPVIIFLQFVSFTVVFSLTMLF